MDKTMAPQTSGNGRDYMPLLRSLAGWPGRVAINMALLTELALVHAGNAAKLSLRLKCAQMQCPLNPLN